MYRSLRLLSATLLALAALVLVQGSARADDDDYEAGQIVVSLNPGFTIEDFNARWGTTTLDAYVEGNLYLLDASAFDDPELLALQMATDPAVLEAEANYFQDTPEGVRFMVVVAIGGSYVDYEDQEIGTRLELEAAHQFSRGAGITVGVIDTGVDPTHPALAGRLTLDGYDFVENDKTPWEESNGLDDDADGSTDEGFGHGTMVAGIIALVAPEAQILPVRVLDDEGRADAFRIAKAIRYAVIHGADVLNLSFGVPRSISIIGHQVSFAAETHGIPVIAGAGNENSGDNPYYPAKDSDAIMVTSLDSLDVKADFADWDGKVLVSAPGTGVRSSYPGGLWALASGNSFATPFVTGAAALVLSINPSLTPEFVENRLESSVDPIYQHSGNNSYEDELGTGRINLLDAVDDLAPVSAPEGLAAARVRVYPNPTTATVRIELVSPTTGPTVTDARILDASGRVVVNLTPSDTGFVWNGLLANGAAAPAGVYFARIATASGIEKATIQIVR